MNTLFRNIVLSTAAAALGLAAGATAALAAFPEKPITILAYMKPGGAADIDSRKLAVIAERLTGAKFVVKNKTGAGGIIAMKYVLEQPADGYLLMATTKSQVYKLVTAKSDINVEDFQWLALNQHDPEAIITNKEMDVNSWEQVVADAKAKAAKGKRQIWVGPAAGGLDHVMAMKTWAAAGIDPKSVKYIPFKGGKKAMIELLGGRGVVYVGNPRDTLGQPKLKVAALSRKTRLKTFPDAPTFGELGVPNLDNEIMWRGFAIKAGIPAEASKFWNDLFAKVSKDPEWVAHVEKSSIDPVYISNDDFLKVIKTDMDEVKVWAKKSGILK
ncbi:MAG: tripartite tricarboxylate transporter substrate binding protein [Hyphomicrobiales bacterium]|nr:MAG: tripartite tricarboxylate transporter substrate binding protein [Hyphomicrobiales bacterium]